MRVLIVTVPVQDITIPPGALGILAAACEQVNADYRIVDLNLRMYNTLPEHTVNELISDFYNNKFRNTHNKDCYSLLCDHLIQEISQYNPTHVAISVFTWASILAVDTLLSLFNKDRNFKVVIGGLGVERSSSFTNGKTFGRYCIDEGLTDYVIYGEGDVAFTELLQGNDTYPGINQENPVQLTSLDDLPIPSYKQIDPSKYYYASQPTALITGSRGCVRKCTFCDVAQYWSKFVFKSGERIAHEMLAIWKETGVLKFDFSDSLINGSMKSFRQLNKTLIQLKNQHPGFTPSYNGQFICRPATLLKEQDYEDMANAGCETLVIGIESFSESVRLHMKKKFNNDSIEWHFAMSAKYNIKNVLLMISGYVTETLEDHQINLEYLKKLQVYALSRTIYSVSIEVRGLEITPGTPLRHATEELQIHYDSADSSDWVSLENPSLTPKERMRRSLEVMLVAAKLGYGLLHLGQKIDRAKQAVANLDSLKTPKKLFKIYQ